MSAGRNPFQEQLRLHEGEELVASMDVSSASHLDLTNHRLIVWQRSGGLERVTPVKLTDIAGLELQEESEPLWHLLGAVLMAVAGAPLLSYAADSLSRGQGGEARLLGVVAGVIGIGLVVGGLVLLSNYLRRIVFPATQLVLHGAPELRLYVSSDATGAARELMRHIHNLKSPPPIP